MKRTYIKEIESDDPDALNIEKAINKLRDEVTVYIASMYRGNNRDLAMVITKLDEAYGFAVRHAVNTGRVAIVDRAALLQAAHEGVAHARV